MIKEPTTKRPVIAAVCGRNQGSFLGRALD